MKKEACGLHKLLLEEFFLLIFFFSSHFSNIIHLANANGSARCTKTRPPSRPLFYKILFVIAPWSRVSPRLFVLGIWSWVDLAIINETEKIGKLRSGAGRDEIRVQMAHSVVLLVKWPTARHVHRVRIKVPSKFRVFPTIIFLLFLKGNRYRIRACLSSLSDPSNVVALLMKKKGIICHGQ